MELLEGAHGHGRPPVLLGLLVETVPESDTRLGPVSKAICAVARPSEGLALRSRRRNLKNLINLIDLN